MTETEKPKMLIEIGANCNVYGFALTTPRESVDRLMWSIVEAREDFGDQVDAVFMPYEGLHGSPLSFYDRRADRVGLAQKDLRRTVETCNKHRAPFNLAFNTGFEFEDAPFDINEPRFQAEFDALKTLAETGEKHDVKNYVTIYLDSLHEAVKKTFPELGTIASCTRYTGGKPGQFTGMQRYVDDFTKFDHVVLATQHSHPETLSIPGVDPGRAVVFPFLACSQHDMTRCHAHYRNIPFDEAPAEFAKHGGFEPMPVSRAQLLEPNGCGGNYIIYNDTRFNSLLAKGLGGLKIQRGYGFSGGMMNMLIDKFLMALNTARRATP